jgi:hypothetical protein
MSKDSAARHSQSKSAGSSPMKQTTQASNCLLLGLPMGLQRNMNLVKICPSPTRATRRPTSPPLIHRKLTLHFSSASCIPLEHKASWPQGFHRSRNPIPLSIAWRRTNRKESPPPRLDHLKSVIHPSESAWKTKQDKAEQVKLKRRLSREGRIRAKPSSNEYISSRRSKDLTNDS